MRSHSSGVTSCRSFPSIPIPALLIRMSQRLCRWATASPNWATAEAFIRSQWKTDAAPPASTISSHTWFSLAALRATSSTCAPMEARRRAMASPTPRAAPVTTATCDFSSFMMYLFMRQPARWPSHTIAFTKSKKSAHCPYQVSLKLPVAVLGDHQFQLAHPRLQSARLVAVAPAAPHFVALVALGAKKTGHLSFKNLLHRALNQIAEKIFPAQALLPSRHNLNTLSLASHLGLFLTNVVLVNNILRNR